MGFICVIFQNGFFGNLKIKSKIEKIKELFLLLQKLIFGAWVKVTVDLWLKKSQPQDMEKVTTL